MKRTFIVSIIVVLAIVVAALVSAMGSTPTASAGDARQIHWKVEWGQRDQYGYWVTQRSLSSNIATRLYEQVYFVHMGTTSSVVYDVSTNPTVRQGAADPASLWQAGNYQIGDEGASFSRAGTNWASSLCLPGPTFDVVLTDAATAVTVTNTTTRTLFAQIGGTGTTGFITIEPSQTLKIDDQSSSGYIALQVNNRLNSWDRCADLAWHLPSWATATPTATPTSTATSTLTPTPTPTPTATDPRITGLGIRLFDDKRTVTIDGDGFLLNPALEQYVQTTDNNGGFWNMGSPTAGGEWTSTRITFTLPADFSWKTVSMRVVVGETRSNWATISVPEPTATPTPTPTNEVKDVRVSNVTDSSFSVSFLSTYPSTTHLGYWISGSMTTTLAVTRELLEESGETHWFQAIVLQPDTVYQFAVPYGGIANTYATPFTGTVRTKTRGEINTPRIGFGRLIDSAGQGVYGALVYVTEDSKELLSAVTNRDGWWSTDLNSAEPRVTGSVHSMGGGPGTLVRVEATAGSFGSAVKTVPTDFVWPLTLNLRPVVSRTIALGTGWNTMALPLEPLDVAKVSDLVQTINANGATRLTSIYRYGKLGWQGSVVSGTVVFGEDFPILVGEGYFLEMDQPSEWTLRGFTSTQVIPLNLGVGWNLVGVPSPVGLNAFALSDAAGMITGTTTYNIAEVDRWVYGHYEGHVAGYAFNNFSIEADRAYFVRANRWGRLDPGVGFTPLQ